MTILTFFLHRPILRRDPRFFLIVVPVHWIFWDIPTHLETSFRYLQKEANDIRAAALGRDPVLTSGSHPDLKLGTAKPDVPSKPETTPSNGSVAKVSKPTSSDILAARCKLGSISGTLVINFGHIRFVRHFPKEEMWKRAFGELVEVRKGNGQTAIDKNAENTLELEFADGSIEKLGELQSKDEIFNVIVAFSGLAWQQL